MGGHHPHGHQPEAHGAGAAFRWSIALNCGLTALQLPASRSVKSR